MALADEVTSILTYKPSLEVRPSSSVAKYAEGNPDPVQAGRELHVAAVVTGHFMHEGDKLSITLEAIDVKDNRLIWHGTISVPADNRLQMLQELKDEVRQELLPYVTGAAAGGIETATRPQNAEAYDLFLRSVAVPHDPEPNREAISMLERSVGLDPGYAPAWDALGLRYYFESTYGSGGGQMFDRANNAYERSVALDPNFLLAAVHLAVNRVERGELGSAYQHARLLVARRSDNAQAHFALSYVLRYAGLLPDAARECNIAFSLDPGDYILRSCAQVFEELGDEDRALQFLNLDAGSQFYNSILPRILMRKGDIAGARSAAEKVKNDETWYGGLLQSCLASGGKADDKLAADVRAALPQMLAQRDPEFHYDQGSMLVYCGERQAAVRLLQAAINQNYCAAEAFTNDPLLQKLRAYPEFKQLREASDACLKRFLAARDQQAP
jgi:tetratricopeptide (TPR) repeat protein